MEDIVELVVKIDRETYNDLKAGKIYKSSHDVPLESAVAIANGIPLDKIKGLRPKTVIFDEWVTRPLRAKWEEIKIGVESEEEKHESI